jgi:hypothetical protein
MSIVKSTKSKKSRTPASAFEGLESRRLMDATSFYLVNGTPGNDVITVKQQQIEFVAASTRGFKAGGLGKVIGGLTDSDKFTININGVVTNVTIPASQRIRIQGMDGNDRIQVIGARGADMLGNAGSDTMIGGDGADIYAGGDGRDIADYSGRYSNLILTIDNQANDGRANEGDNIASDVEEVDAGQGNDYVSASTISSYGAVTLIGNLGNDTMMGSAGWDYISGGRGNDQIHGGAGRDIIAGDEDNDVLWADSGNDGVFGGPGNDRLYSGTDNDALYGGTGKDILVAIGGGQSDQLWGGSDADTFWLDRESSETIPDYQYATEAKTYHRVAAFDNLRVNGQDMGAPSRDLQGQNLPDPITTEEDETTHTRYSYCHAWDHNPLFASNGPTADDVDQNQLGDCYFLAPLSAIARSTPDVIRQRIVDLGDGTFAVNFKTGSTDHFVRVDGELPVSRYNSMPYAGLGKGGSIWIPIMEKAWAFYRKNFGTYHSIEGGQPNELFNALGVTNQTAYKTSQNLTSMIKTITDELAKGLAVTLCTKVGATSVVENHCYMVSGIVRDHRNGQDKTLIVLRNPWATDGVGGDSVSDGYVTIDAAKLFNDYTRIVASKA